MGEEVRHILRCGSKLTWGLARLVQGDQRTLSTAARHSKDLRVRHEFAPETEQCKVGGGELNPLWTRAALVEDMFVQQVVKSGNGDTERLGGFLLGVELLYRFRDLHRACTLLGRHIVCTCSE